MSALLDAFTLHLGVARACIEEIESGLIELNDLDQPDVATVDKASAFAEALVIAWAELNEITVEDVLGRIDYRLEHQA